MRYGNGSGFRRIAGDVGGPGELVSAAPTWAGAVRAGNSHRGGNTPTVTSCVTTSGPNSCPLGSFSHPVSHPGHVKAPSQDRERASDLGQVLTFGGDLR